jgi:hypothetical protein
MRPIATPAIIDVEASGFDPQSYPIEIGVALDNGDKFCTLIQPQDDWTHWDDGAEQVHQVTREMLMSNGSPVQDVTAQLNDLLAGMTLYSDGWVVDKPWLIKLFHAAATPMLFSVSPIELILNEEQLSIWHPTKEQIADEVNLMRHRASNDAWIIQETYRQTLAAIGRRQYA